MEVARAYTAQVRPTKEALPKKRAPVVHPATSSATRRRPETAAPQVQPVGTSVPAEVSTGSASPGIPAADPKTEAVALTGRPFRGLTRRLLHPRWRCVFRAWQGISLIPPCPEKRRRLEILNKTTTRTTRKFSARRLAAALASTNYARSSSSSSRSYLAASASYRVTHAPPNRPNLSCGSGR